MTDNHDLPSVPTPHGEKLTALTNNARVPAEDGPKVQETIERYQTWRTGLLEARGSDEEIITSLVAQLNEYKRFIEVDLIFDSSKDWLYRQKGQTKLDNSIMEEFLPALVLAVHRTRLTGGQYQIGPTKCFSGLRFLSSFATMPTGAGATVKAKDQDFAISRPVYIQTSHFANFAEPSTSRANLAYIAAECKTNLDKTMFQEAASTAQEVKTSVAGAKYYLLCEWLDMTPISTSVTPIDEIIILRRAKRLSSNIRSAFSKAAERQQKRGEYVAFLDENPISLDAMNRFMGHVKAVLDSESLETDQVLEQGYF